MNIRALPIGLPPVNQETLGSYLHRIADANHITIAAIAQILGTSRRYRRTDDDPTIWTTNTVTALATLTGRSANTLTRALPALRPLATAAAAATPSRPTAIPPRVACRHCMASKGIHGLVLQRAASHERVCPRHQRWLHGPEQHALHTLPEIRQANLRHRRLICRYDTAAGDAAYAQALQLVHERFIAADQPDLQHRWTQRLGLLRRDPHGDPYRPSLQRLELVTYPETVSLTKHLTSTPCTKVADLPGEPSATHPPSKTGCTLLSIDECCQDGR